MVDPKVSIIILNYNGWKDTIECLESLYQIVYKNFEVILVDNGSTDESIKKIKDYCKEKIAISSKFLNYSIKNKPIHIIEYTRMKSEHHSQKKSKTPDLSSKRKMILIKNERNYGFAEGNNIGIRYALKDGAKWVLVLNNDTFVDKNLVSAMISAGNISHNIGIVGPKSYHYNVINRLGCTGGKINFWTGNISHLYAGEEDRGQFEKIEFRDFISGTCMLLSKNALETCGYLNPCFYFAGGEDVDIGLRVKRNGFKVVSTPYAILWHKGESYKGLGLNEKRLQLYAYYSIRNYLILLKLHWSSLQLAVALMFLPLKCFKLGATFIRNKWSPKLLKEPISGIINLLKSGFSETVNP